MTLLKPIGVTTFYIASLYILAVLLKDSWVFISAESLRFLVLALGFLVPTALFSWQQQHPMNWYNSGITFLILLLLADTTASLPLIFVLGLVTFVFKVFIRLQGHPFFNPAAAGLATLSLFGLTTTWWGVSFAPRFTQLGLSSALLFTLPLGLFIIWKYQKLPTFFATIISFAVPLWIVTNQFPLQLLLDGTFVFFLFIMATEPKTTPVIDTQEWLFGVLLGLSLALWFYFKLPLPYLLNLVVLSGAFSVFKWVKMRSLMVQSQ